MVNCKPHFEERKMYKVYFALIVSTFLLIVAMSGCFNSKIICKNKRVWFSGYEWNVKNSNLKIGPGPNNWKDSNVWVDSNGYLHLRITHESGKWYCAEVSTVKNFGFGKYQFEVMGNIDQMDKNVVLGLFSYPPPKVGPDGTNEVDIEFAKWSDANSKYNGWYTVWSRYRAYVRVSHPLHFLLQENLYTTHEFIRKSNEILFRSFYGKNESQRQIEMWDFKPKNYFDKISQGEMPVHINLWLFDGKPPSNNKEVEVVICSFRYVPNL